eukprot:920012_1
MSEEKLGDDAVIQSDQTIKVDHNNKDKIDNIQNFVADNSSDDDVLIGVNFITKSTAGGPVPPGLIKKSPPRKYGSVKILQRSKRPTQICQDIISLINSPDVNEERIIHQDINEDDDKKNEETIIHSETVTNEPEIVNNKNDMIILNDEIIMLKKENEMFKKENENEMLKTENEKERLKQ